MNYNHAGYIMISEENVADLLGINLVLGDAFY